MTNLAYKYGMSYSKPNVTLLQESGIGVSEIASRTAYDSFNKSENECICNATKSLDINAINSIESSDLLHSLAWVNHHHSVLEHTSLSFLIEGTSRGVLQEHARHRIQAITVRSTRYTMSSVINAFIAFSKVSFIDKVLSFDMLVTTDTEYNRLEIGVMYDKLMLQFIKLGHEEFYKVAVAKSSLPIISSSKDANELFKALEAGKKKRNVGDAFKHIVTDNWKVDMVVTFNLRSLKNYFDLRDSGASYFQIQWLAKAIKEATPNKYLTLIVKENK